MSLIYTWEVEVGGFLVWANFAYINEFQDSQTTYLELPLGPPKKPGMVAHTLIPALERQKQEGSEASLV